jgi:uncharacterized membrane protein
MFEELLAVVGPLLLTGVVQKHWTKIPNNAIPYVNGILGTGVGIWASGGDVPAGIQLGLMASASATGIHQVLKVALNKATGKKV